MAEVIPLRPDHDPDGPGVMVKDRTRCSHRGSELDPDSHRVFCTDCGVELDAFERLLKIAREHERRVATIEELKVRERLLHASVESLQREERNAKARRRRREGVRRRPVPGPWPCDWWVENVPMSERGGPT